jgi:low affinity Fe/Cu permease
MISHRHFTTIIVGLLVIFMLIIFFLQSVVNRRDIDCMQYKTRDNENNEWISQFESPDPEKKQDGTQGQETFGLVS